MTIGQHEIIIGSIGISTNQEDVGNFANKLPAEIKAFITWWMEIGRKKSLDR